MPLLSPRSLIERDFRGDTTLRKSDLAITSNHRTGKGSDRTSTTNALKSESLLWLFLDTLGNRKEEKPRVEALEHF